MLVPAGSLLMVAPVAAWFAVTTRSAWKRAVSVTVGLAVTGAAVASVVVFTLTEIGGLLVILVAALAFRAGARRAVLVDRPTPAGRPRPAHPWLLVNPWSGGGTAARAGLVPAAEAAGFDVHVLARGDDPIQLARIALAGGADVLAVAGGDGTLALVAGVAVEHDVPFLCVPAGTRNHFARDLGLDRSDPLGALQALDGREVRVDAAFVGDRLFLNNVSLGVYAHVVAEPDYRDQQAEHRTRGAAPARPGRTRLRFDERPQRRGAALRAGPAPADLQQPLPASEPGPARRPRAPRRRPPADLGPPDEQGLGAGRAGGPGGDGSPADRAGVGPVERGGAHRRQPAPAARRRRRRRVDHPRAAARVPGRSEGASGAGAGAGAAVDAGPPAPAGDPGALAPGDRPGQAADRRPCDSRTMSSQVRHVNHLHLVVTDLRRSVHFYRTAFEFEERYTSAAGVVFLRSPAGGSLALEQAGAGRPPGLGHFGFSLSSGSAVTAVVGRVVASGGGVVELGELVTGDPHAVVTDPDGHVIRL